MSLTLFLFFPPLPYLQEFLPCFWRDAFFFLFFFLTRPQTCSCFPPWPEVKKSRLALGRNLTAYWTTPYVHFLVCLLVFLSPIGPRLIPRAVQARFRLASAGGELYGPAVMSSSCVNAAFICIGAINLRKVEARSTCESSQTFLWTWSPSRQVLDWFGDSFNQTLPWN